MADLEWNMNDYLIDKEGEVLPEQDPSQHLIESRSWMDVNLLDQTVSPEALSMIPQEEHTFGEGYTGGYNLEHLPEDIGGITGGIIGTARGWKVPGNLRTRAISSMYQGVIGAFTGGAIAEGGQQVFYSATDSEKAPDGYMEGINQAFLAGGEQAIYEAIGHGIVNVVGAGYRFLRGKPKTPESVVYDPSQQGDAAYREIMPDTKLAEGEQVIPVTQMVLNLMEESGGTMTAAQVTNNLFINGLEGLSRVAWGGGILRSARLQTDEALMKYIDDYVKHFNKTAGEVLGREEVGLAFKNVIDTAKLQHSEIAGDMYKAMDDAYVPFIKKVKETKRYQSDLINPTTLKNFNRLESQIVEKEILPVSLKELKKYAQKIIDKGKPVEGLTVGDIGVLKKILTSDDRISFSVAKDLRSTFLAESRSMEQTFGKENAKRIAGDMERIIENSMHQGAKATKNKEFMTLYENVNKFWRGGSETVKAKNIAELIKLQPEFIGETVFKSGNISEVRAVKAALFKAAEYSRIQAKKGIGEAFDAHVEWQKMQTGYLNSLINTSKSNAEALLHPTGKILQDSSRIYKDKLNIKSTELNLANMKALFIKGTPQNDTFRVAFSPPQQNAIREFVNTLEMASTRTSAAGDFMVKVTQAGLILEIWGITNVLPGASDDDGKSAKEIAFKTGAFTIAPWVVSKIMTYPANVRLLSRAMRTNQGSRQFAALSLQVINMIGGIYDDNPEEFLKNEEKP
tara:strand:- start:52 stop:2268 length:2217 start_codon:yes stop_codon:yes gene_type:complete